ncbi:uncharacterized protein LOC133923408 [Phragmites australis]|uniref:uncharacterized protein LOC133923408 n=1 Tax=Phragmites australis TaxID=29695 RepID=UPI002D767428|nr:uncharacterized protein LOC133923408 [Phragmites australis]
MYIYVTTRAVARACALLLTSSRRAGPAGLVLSPELILKSVASRSWLQLLAASRPLLYTILNYLTTRWINIAGAMAVNPLDLWNHWAIQILVLLSLALQVVLLLLAGIRRGEASLVLKLLLWLAYLLADSTAIYTIGHLSLSATADRHQLVAFWAPFLLLHLGGPDNITAYSLQDNELWLRHLQTLTVQVLGTAYVLYKHIAGNGSLVVLASILMFAVGVVKYGERTWALRRGNTDSIRGSLKNQSMGRGYNHFHPQDRGLDREEFQLRRAHTSFHICKRAIVDSSVDIDSDDHDTSEKLVGKRAKCMWLLMEMELSLMYDILYTKAAVIHTWYGYCIRLFSPLAVAASLLLFYFSSKDGHSTVDVVVTYVLLVGALLLETTSLLNALGSTWTFAYLCATRCCWLRHTLLCSGRWDRLRRALVSLRLLIRTTTGRSSRRSARRWSGTMGQYNMLHFCSLCDKPGGPLLGRLAKMLGFKELWDKKHYSGKTQISKRIKDEVNKYIDQLPDGESNKLGVLRNKWSQIALKDYKEADYLSGLSGDEFQEGIIVWHIATDIFLARSGAKNEPEAVEAVRAMSNYMMFLLVERPYMLPGLSQYKLYQKTCEWLVKIRTTPHPRKGLSTMLKDLFRLRNGPNSDSRLMLQRQPEFVIGIFHKYGPLGSESPRRDTPRLSYATSIAETLLKMEPHISSLQRLLEVWADFLVYAANRCSREYHAKQLSDGGELTTVLWLMMEHLHQASLYAPGRSHPAASRPSPSSW